MSAYSEMVNLMRVQGAAENPEDVSLAEMTGPNSCRMGDFELQKDDLYIAEHLLKTVAIKVSVNDAHQDKSTYIQPLKAGDLVVVKKINETAYVVLERVVKV